MKRFNGSGHFGSGAGSGGDNADFGLSSGVGGISLSPRSLSG